MTEKRRVHRFRAAKDFVSSAWTKLMRRETKAPIPVAKKSVPQVRKREDPHRHQVERQMAKLILVGRYGRACRVYARAFGTSPRLAESIADRKEWARKVLAR